MPKAPQGELVTVGAQSDRDNLRVLVTGGAGFIGANLVRALASSGYQITVLDNFSTGEESVLKDVPCQIVRGTILDPELVASTIADHDAVVHLAAQAGVQVSLESPRLDHEVNVIGTINVLEGCRARVDAGLPAPRVVLASSNAPIGRQKPPAVETIAPLPISPYGASKLSAEAYCLAYHGSWGIPTVILRFGNVYGPFSTNKSSVVARFITDLKSEGSLTIDGDGQQTRDFIHTSDLCTAIIAAVESDIAGEVFQIATGIETSIVDLARTLLRVSGIDGELSFGPSRPADIVRNYSIISKAEEMLGWKPQIMVEEGLRDTWEWFERHQPAESANSGS